MKPPKPAKYKPLGPYALIQQDPKPEKVGNILLPDSAKQALGIGTVLDRGHVEMEGGKTRPVRVEAGQRVTFKPYAVMHMSSVIPDEDENLILVKEDDITTVIVG